MIAQFESSQLNINSHCMVPVKDTYLCIFLIGKTVIVYYIGRPQSSVA